jgi:AraC-like DNA-binding protein
MMETILWVGFSQSVFAGILIHTKKNISVSDRILVAWLFLLAIEFLTCAIDYKIFGTPLLSSSLLLFNPACYLYIKSLTKRNFKLKFIQLLHLFPFVFFESAAYYFQETISLNYYFYQDETFYFRILFGIANILSWAIYNSLSIIILINHRIRIVNEFSNIQIDKSLGWVLFIVVFYNLYCIAAITIGANVVFSGDRLLLPHIFNYSALLFLIYILGFYGLRQTEIFKKDLTKEIVPTKYANSNLSAERKEKIKEKINEYFSKSKPYLNPEFNMDTLSENLNIPKHHITEVLSTIFKKNFYNFVNEYRVNDVITILQKENNPYSIEAIGYECGFKSKSSFFSVFKKVTGYTPSQYKKGKN